MPIKKILKISGKVMLVLIGIIFIVLIGIFVFHKYMSRKEYNLLNDAGFVNSVSAGDYNLNAYIYGNENGNHTKPKEY